MLNSLVKLAGVALLMIEQVLYTSCLIRLELNGNCVKETLGAHVLSGLEGLCCSVYACIL
jgi:hypothetical protein